MLYLYSLIPKANEEPKNCNFTENLLPTSYVQYPIL